MKFLIFFSLFIQTTVFAQEFDPKPRHLSQLERAIKKEGLAISDFYFTNQSTGRRSDLAVQFILKGIQTYQKMKSSSDPLDQALAPILRNQLQHQIVYHNDDPHPNESAMIEYSAQNGLILFTMGDFEKRDEAMKESLVYFLYLQSDFLNVVKAVFQTASDAYLAKQVTGSDSKELALKMKEYFLKLNPVQKSAQTSHWTYLLPELELLRYEVPEAIDPSTINIEGWDVDTLLQLTKEQREQAMVELYRQTHGTTF